MSSTARIALIVLGLFTLAFLMNAIAPVHAQSALTLTVRVYTMDGKPLANAFVELKHDGTRVEIKKTGSDGRVSFSNLAADKLYRVHVYYPAGHEVAEPLSDINVAETPNINVTVRVLSRWTIYVYDGRERDAVPEAKITVTHRANRTITYSGSTDSDGKVTFGPIPSDSSYDISVDFRGRRYSFEDADPSGQMTKLKLPLYRVSLLIVDGGGSPVKDVEVELRESLEGDPAARAVSGSDGVVLMKLIPADTRYYVVARLKGITVYASTEREIAVSNDDISRRIIVNAVKLNITIADYDGEDILKDYALTGKLIKDGVEVGSAQSDNGVMRFGHTPFETYTLKIMLGDMTVYSGTYAVNAESAKGVVKAWFHDIKIRINASALANASLAKSLSGELRSSDLRFEFQAADWEASIKNVPRWDNYEALLFYSGREVFRISGLKIVGENQVLWLNLTGHKLDIITVNLDDEPVGANVVVMLDGVGAITSFKTDDSGRGSPGRLLPLTYRLEAYVDGMPVGQEVVDLTSGKSMRMRLSLKNLYFRILDRDGEEALESASITLIHGKFSRSGKYVDDRTLLVRNLPIAEYRLIVTYYGFKVLEDLLKISPEDKLLELRAPGILDVELIFLDSDRKPLDGGRAMVSIGEHEFESEIGQDGRAAFKNLPNVTLSIGAFYRNIKIRVDPNEVDLIRDDMRVMIACSVHSFEAEILRGDGKPLSEGAAALYINGMLLKTYDLAKGNKISERLPEGDLRIEMKYRGRDIGLFSTYLEKSITGLSLYSTIYPVEIFVRNPDGSPIAGAKLTVEDEMGVIAETVSGSDGALRLLLPAAESYNATIRVDSEIYGFKFSVERSKSMSFLRPTPLSMGFELAIAASAINLAISGYAISRLPHGRQQPRRRERVVRRRIPRV